MANKVQMHQQEISYSTFVKEVEAGNVTAADIRQNSAVPTAAFAVRYICLKFGYKFGTSFLNKIEESGMMPKLTFGAAVLGLMVIGAMIPSMITVNIAGAIGSGDAAVKVQEILDGIMPNLVPFAMTLGIYGLLQKKVKVSWILIVLMIVGIVGALLGIF